MDSTVNEFRSIFICGRFTENSSVLSADIAVAAPFEGNGAVYIFHGGPNGLSNKPSQRLSAPAATDLSNAISMQDMFGHGLSKGADIDGNHYLDLAVGAPNAETVYVYKAYPVVRINATLTPHSQEIKTTDHSFKFSACWSMETMHPLDFTVRFHALIKMDGQLGRAKFDDRTNLYEINSTATVDEQCVELKAFITFSIADIFKPIELEMAYNIVDDVPQVGSGNHHNSFSISVLIAMEFFNEKFHFRILQELCRCESGRSEISQEQSGIQHGLQGGQMCGRFECEEFAGGRFEIAIYFGQFFVAADRLSHREHR